MSGKWFYSADGAQQTGPVAREEIEQRLSRGELDPSTAYAVWRLRQQVFVVEQNRDAQLKSLLTLETHVEKSKLRSILHYSGLPMTSKEIVDSVLAELGDAARRAALTAAQ